MEKLSAERAYIMASASKTTVTEVAVPKAEDSLGVKWDKCLTDSAIKMGAGFALGDLSVKSSALQLITYIVLKLSIARTFWMEK